MELDAHTTVLLACLRSEETATLNARLAQLTPAEWDALLRLAGRHGVMPLLYRRLQPLASEAQLPPDILQALHTKYLANSGRNTQLYHQLAAVLRLLRRENLPVIVLKGAHLAEVVYDNIALRPMSDVDLLIRKTDLPRVEALLLDNGYRADPQNGPAMQAGHFHYGFHDVRAGWVLEIHWHILRPQLAAFIDIDEFWREAAPAKIGGVETLVLSPAHLLLHLCYHLYHHRFEANLRALCDIAEVVHRYGPVLDWTQLCEDIREKRARKVVYLALRLTKELLGAPIPGDILGALYAGDASPWEVAVREQILNLEPAALSLEALELSQLWGKQPLRQKAAVLLRGLFPSAEMMAQLHSVPAGRLRHYLYYPRHLRWLLGKFGLTAWRLLRGDPALRQEAARLEALDQWLRSP